MRRHLSTLWVLAFWALTVGCAHTAGKGTVEGLKSAGDMFLQRLRWRDFRGASELVLADRRNKYDRAISDLKDENDLTVTDYQLEDVRLSPTEKDVGLVIARVRWVRMPSVTEHNAVVTSEFVLEHGVWFLFRQDKGPFADVLNEPLKQSRE
jgi:hypothetical protein